jgi:histidinol-phosphate aminotransferase
MFAVEASLAGARVVTAERGDLAVRQPVEAIRAAAEEASARLVWLCSPNNPTGDAYEVEEIRRLADGLGAFVVVDEVYLEFAEQTRGAAPNTLSATQLQDELPNILVLRSLSKAYGLAGARIGYLVVAEPLVARFDAVRLPLSVAGPSEAIAIEALRNPDEARARRAAALAERDRLAQTLARLGCRVLPSVANFVTFRPPDAEALADALESRGIILRRYGSGPMAGWLRATARIGDEADRFIQALEELLS